MSGEVIIVDEGLTPVELLKLPGPPADCDPDPRHTFGGGGTL